MMPGLCEGMVTGTAQTAGIVTLLGTYRAVGVPVPGVEISHNGGLPQRGEVHKGVKGTPAAPDLIEAMRRIERIIAQSIPTKTPKVAEDIPNQ